MTYFKTKLTFFFLLFLPLFSWGQLSIKMDQDTVVLCAGSEANLNVTVSNGTGAQVAWISNSTDLKLNDTSGIKTTASLNVDHKGIDTMILVAEATWNQEIARDSAVLILSELPDFEVDHRYFQVNSLNEPYLFCEFSRLYLYGTLPHTEGTWSVEGRIISESDSVMAIVPKERPFYAKYTFSNAVGCTAEDSVQLEIELLPRVEFVTPDTVIKTLELKHHQHTIPVTYRYWNTSGVTLFALSSGSSFTKTSDSTVDFRIDDEVDTTIQKYILFIQTDPGNACPFVENIFYVNIQYDSTLLGLGSLNTASRVQMYPNPVQANDPIIFPIHKSRGFEVHVFTLAGKEVPIESYSNREIQISNAGIYIVIVKDLNSGELFWDRIVVTN
jgi:hypothetical protein